MESITWFITLIIAVQGQVIKLDDPPCQNYQQAEAGLTAAKAIWTEPPCYDFSYTFTGFQRGTPSPKSVQVRNGVVTGEGDKHMGDFFDMIESLCIQDCPTSGAARCSNTYSDQGFPTSIDIDMSKFTPDGARSYTISDFAVVDCSSAQQIQDGENNLKATEDSKIQFSAEVPVDNQVDADDSTEASQDRVSIENPNGNQADDSAESSEGRVSKAPVVSVEVAMDDQTRADESVFPSVSVKAPIDNDADTDNSAEPSEGPIYIAPVVSAEQINPYEENNIFRPTNPATEVLTDQKEKQQLQRPSLVTVVDSPSNAPTANESTDRPTTSPFGSLTTTPSDAPSDVPSDAPSNVPVSLFPTNPTNTTQSGTSSVDLREFQLLLDTLKELNSTLLVDIIDLYLAEAMIQFDSFSDVILFITEENAPRKFHRTLQGMRSVRLSGEVLFEGIAPSTKDFIDVQLSSLENEARLQAALDAGGVDAKLKGIVFLEPDASEESSTFEIPQVSGPLGNLQSSKGNVGNKSSTVTILVITAFSFLCR